MSKFIHALSVVTITTALLVGESPTQAQSDLSSKITSAPGRSFRSVGTNKMSAAARDAITHGAEIISIPHFAGSFTTDGVVYPFIMLGGNPTQGGITCCFAPSLLDCFQTSFGALAQKLRDKLTFTGAFY
jgi:hypothetical protein